MALNVRDLSDLNDLEDLVSKSNNPVVRKVYEDQRAAFQELRTNFEEIDRIMNRKPRSEISVRAPQGSSGLGSSLFSVGGPALFNAAPLGIQGNRRGLLGS